MSSWQARVAAWWWRHKIPPRTADGDDLLGYGQLWSRRRTRPRGTRIHPASMGGVPGEWVLPRRGPAPPHRLLYLHGGGFVGGSPASHRPITAALARLGLSVFVPAYSLAPAHPFPAALRDVQMAWEALADTGPGQDHPQGRGRRLIAGDGSGGNLALALMLWARDAQAPQADAALLWSPVTDLRGPATGRRRVGRRDAVHREGVLARTAQAYLQGIDPTQPLASPLLADLHGLPPLMLQVGEDECLCEDSLLLAGRASEAQVAVSLHLWPTVPHAWPLLHWLPESRRSVALAAAFLHQASGGVDRADPVSDARRAA